MLYYFLPDTPLVTGHSWPAVRSKFELAHLEGTDVTAREIHAGPDGQRGCLIAPRPHGRPANGLVAYHSDGQYWDPRFDGRYWIGWPLDSPPAPEELARKRGVAGRRVELGDGNEWIVPVLQFFQEKDGHIIFDDIGALPHLPTDRNCVAFKVKHRFSQIHTRARDIWERTFLSEAKDFAVIPLPERLEFVADVLALAYHVDLELLLALGALGNDDVEACLETIFDTPALLAIIEAQAEKKSEESAGSSGTTGGEA